MTPVTPVAPAGRSTVMRRLAGFRRRSDERGAIAIMAAVFMTALVFSAALSVDIGGRVQEVRRAQATADLAAMDASRDLSSDATTQDLAWRSALRNGVDHTKPGYSVVATRGVVSNGVFAATGTNPSAVQVQVTTPYGDFFGGTSARLSASAVASNTGLGQFVIGATLAEINGGLTALLGSGTSLALAGYNGLASGMVSLAALATQLGIQAVTPAQVLASQVTVGQLVNASAGLLAATNPTAAVSLAALGTTLLSKSINNNNPVNLGSALGLTTGNGVGLGTTLNLLQAVNGSLQLANQKAGIDLDLNVNLAGLAGVSLALTAITPPTVSAYGPPGTTATNAQVTLNLTLDLNVPLVLSAHLPLSVTIGATGTLNAVTCGGQNNPLSMRLGTQFQALNLVVQPGATVSAVLGLLSGPISGNILIAANSVADTVLSNPTNFVSGQVPVLTNLGLGAVTSNLIGSGLGGLVSSLVNAVAPIISPVVLAATTALSALGIHVGTVDYLGVQAACANPRLGL